MRAIIRAMVLLLLASLVFAMEFEISYEPPTQYTDGHDLLEQELDFYTFYCDGARIQELDSIIGSWQRTITIPEPGTFNCHLTTTSLDGVESGPSNSKVFTKGPRTPLPPVLL